MHDVIIVGAGPAGLTAAIYSLRAGRTVLLIEKNGAGGQMTHSPNIENYPGFQAISGNELADRMLEQALMLGADLELEEALEIDGDKKTVTTDRGVHEGKTIIIATGARHRLLGVEGEDRFIGEGISFCAVCDGAFYADRDVAVIGGGNSALQEAVLLSTLCKSVTIIQDLPHLTGEQKLIEKLEAAANVKIIKGARVLGFTGVEELTGVRIAEEGIERTIEVNGAFVAIGLIPETELASGIAALNQWGYIDSDERCRTKTEGVFVAGDCRSKTIRQISTAIADGASAALAANSYLNEQK